MLTSFKALILLVEKVGNLFPSTIDSTMTLFFVCPIIVNNPDFPEIDNISVNNSTVVINVIFDTTVTKWIAKYTPDGGNETLISNNITTNTHTINPDLPTGINTITIYGENSDGVQSDIDSKIQNTNTRHRLGMAKCNPDRSPNRAVCYLSIINAITSKNMTSLVFYTPRIHGID